MGVSRVDYGGETLIDLTGDNVAPNNLLKGNTAHGANGESVEGAVTAVPTTTSLAVTKEGVSALDGAVGKVLNDKGAQINVYKGDDGNLHFRDWAGADTVIPFKNNVPEILIPLITLYQYNPELHVQSYDDIIFNVENYKKVTCSAITNQNGSLTLYLDDVEISLQPGQETLIDGSIFRILHYKPLNASNVALIIKDLRFYN